MLGQIINGQPLRICDGCGCSEHYVSVLILLENDACICNECVGLCVEIIEERTMEEDEKLLKDLRALAEKRVAKIRGSYDVPAFDACVEAELERMRGALIVHNAKEQPK